MPVQTASAAPGVPSSRARRKRLRLTSACVCDSTTTTRWPNERSRSITRADPFAPGASGNVCSEDLIHCLHAMGVETGVDLDALIVASRRVQEIVGHGLPGQIVKAGKWDRRYPFPTACGEASRRARMSRPSRWEEPRMLRLMDRAVTEWSLPVIGGEKGRVLRRLLPKHRPARIEVGSLFGYSAILMAATCPAGASSPAWSRIPTSPSSWSTTRRARGSGPREGGGGRRAPRAPLLRGPVDFILIDAKKEDYLDYLRAVEPRLRKGALVVADNTGMYRRDVKPYLAHVRAGGRYQSREHDFGFDCMEVSVLRG